MRGVTHIDIELFPIWQIAPIKANAAMVMLDFGSLQHKTDEASQRQPHPPLLRSLMQLIQDSPFIFIHSIDSCCDWGVVTQLTSGVI